MLGYYSSLVTPILVKFTIELLMATLSRIRLKDVENMVFCIMYNNLLERYFDAVFVKLFVYRLDFLNLWCLAMQPVSVFDIAPKTCEFMPNINGGFSQLLAEGHLSCLIVRCTKEAIAAQKLTNLLCRTSKITKSNI